MHSFRRLVKRGFTLIELLVVIAIIAILVGILLPVLASALKQGRVTACSSNLHQMHLAVVGYAGDNKNELARGPAESHWFFDGMLGLGLNYEDVADNQIWHNDPEMYVGAGVLLQGGHLSMPEALYCPGDNSTDPQEELESVGSSTRYAYGSYIYRNLDALDGKHSKMSDLGMSDAASGKSPARATLLAMDRQALSTDQNGALQTNHGNDLSNLLFLDGSVDTVGNLFEQNFFSLVPPEGVEFFMPDEVDRVIINGDLYGAGREADCVAP